MTIAGNGGQALPAQVNVVAQYIKDFSFENPNAPRSLMQAASQQPSIDIKINVGVNPVSQSDYEVVLNLEGKADMGAEVLFSFELVYAGLFRIQNIPEGQMHPLLMIECPRILFPFAREIVANAVRNGGYPPLLLDPVDFVAMYQDKVRQMQAQGQPGFQT
jgi:preprotein translocase subunit SecB